MKAAFVYTLHQSLATSIGHGGHRSNSQQKLLAMEWNTRGLSDGQGLIYRPDRPNRQGPVPVYRTGLAENRSVLVEVKFEFKNLSSTGLYRYTGRLDRFTSRFGWYTGDLKKFSDG